jgi:hydroxyacylglutathione hydrolase
MFQVVPVKAFKDNYVWTLRTARHAAVVDPGEAAPVLDYLARENLELAAILATHHHADHVGGIAELLQKYRVPVYGPKKEPIPTLTHPVGGGDSVSIPELGASFSVLDIPGHTRAHIAYYGAGALFCGDTLFACGCGRVFEGTPEQMYASLDLQAGARNADVSGQDYAAAAHAVFNWAASRWEDDRVVIQTAEAIPLFRAEEIHWATDLDKARSLLRKLGGRGGQHWWNGGNTRGYKFRRAEFQDIVERHPIRVEEAESEKVHR